MTLRWALWYNSAHGYFVAHSANDSANGNNTATAPLTYAAMYFAKKYEQMVSKIVTLAGQHKAEELKRNASVEGRVKSENRQDLLIVDAINEAINARKKIAFQYFAYNIRKQKKLRHDGERYIFSPYRLIWNGDYYYVLGYSDKHQAIGSFRVDRISARPDILSEEAVPVPADFGVDDFLATTFRMYGSECQEVELICDNSVIDAIIDRFGTDVTIYACDMSTFRVIVRVAISHIFFIPEPLHHIHSQ